MITIIIIITSVTSVLSSQSFSAQPEDVTVSLGAAVTLPCVVVGQRGTVQVSDNIIFSAGVLTVALHLT